MDRLRDPQKLFRHLLWINILSLVIALICMWTVDQKVSLFFAQERILRYRQWARDLTDAGLSQHYFIGSLFVYAYMRWLAPSTQLWRKHTREMIFLRKWGLNFFVTLISSGILVQLIKACVGRQRPHVSAPVFDPFVYRPFTIYSHWHSFPSGHSQTMFTVATMMTIAFPRLKWLWILYAVIICFTRVVVHDHFVSDTVFGACVGYTGTFIGLYLMQKHTRQGLLHGDI